MTLYSSANAEGCGAASLRYTAVVTGGPCHCRGKPMSTKSLHASATMGLLRLNQGPTNAAAFTEMRSTDLDGFNFKK